MLKSVKARTVLVSSETLPPSVVPELKDEFKKAEIEVEIKEIPALSDIYPDLKSNKKGADVELLPVPKRKVFAEGTEVYLHSSGSSGFPKSIPYTHEFIYALQYQCKDNRLST
jgi:acyl-CoA synthetase (AMP-forming)/AMP-acid ligase II